MVVDPHWCPAQGAMPYPSVPVPSARRGPLKGLRLGVKDVFHVAGYPTSMGQPLLAARLGVASKTAPVVARLLEGGARWVGKTITDELAFSMTGDNVHYGAPINGAAPKRITGGSSTGSASALSHGLLDVALGTDTGGSVRAPANHCGLWGIRPSHGRVSVDGVLAQAPSLDTCGWFTSNAAAFSRVSAWLLDDGLEQAGPVAPRWLWPQDLWALLAPGPMRSLQAVTRAALKGQSLIPVTVLGEDMVTAYWAFRHIQGREVWAEWGAWLLRDQPRLGAAVADRMRWAQTVTAAQAREARAWRRRFSRRMDALLGDDGVLVLPTMPDVAPLRATPEGELEDYRNRALRLLCVAGLAGLPQISMPVARRLRAPLGLSVLGPRGRDAQLVRWAQAFAPFTP